MSFFQNVFDFEFRPTLIGADRQYQTGWRIKGNTNRSDYMVNAQVEPYNLTGNAVLTINYAYDPLLIGYAALAVTITASNIASVTAQEVVNSLNGNSTFASLFTAQVFASKNYPASPGKVLIKSKKPKGGFRAYVGYTSAETVLQFNRNAPIAELPSYFEKFSVANRFDHPDLGPDRLIVLDTGNTYQSNLITWAGLNPSSPKADWQLLGGSSDAYWFYNRTYISGVIATEVKYPAGASEGYLAKKTYYTYNGTDLVGVMETPYVLASGDLITPP